MYEDIEDVQVACCNTDSEYCSGSEDTTLDRDCKYTCEDTSMVVELEMLL